MVHSPHVGIVAIIVFAGCVTNVHGQRVREVSADGLVDVCPNELDEGGIAGGPGASVPFPVLPNWQNTLRRQVGSIKVADMNSDNLADVVVGCYISNSFPPYDNWRNLIYYNTGTGLEAEPSWVSADQIHTGDIQIADINRDGFPDILSVNGGSSHAPSVIYYGGPTGPDNIPDVTLTTPITSWALAAAIFDFDHDDDLDIVTTNQTSITNDWYRPLYMYRNNNGVIETSPSWQTSDTMIANGIDVGDYDHDGWEDIAVAKWVNFEAAIYRNDNGTLQTSPIWTTGDNDGARGAVFGDIDGDGWKDLFFGYDPSRQYRNIAGVLNPNWQSTAPVPSAQEIVLRDVDADGDLDFAEQHFSSGRTHIYLNRDGVLDAAPSWSYDAAPVGTALDFGDINNDGIVDLVTGYSGLPSVMVFYGLPPACEADINGNGGVDVADLLAVIGNWGATGSNPADVNGDRVVNVADLLAVIGSWGPCP